MVVCPHCGGETFGSKIRCDLCGGALGSENSPPPDPHEVPGLSVGRPEVAPAAGAAAEVSVDTGGRRIVDITEQVKSFAGNLGGSGIVNVFLPHATAGLALMETGTGSEVDLGEVVERVFPSDDRYAHSHGQRGHGRDHLLPVFVSQSLTIPVDSGRLFLGTWQSVVLVDTNESNDRRRVRLTFIPR